MPSWLFAEAVHSYRLAMRFPDWTTAVVADACVRLSIPLRLAPPGLRSVVSGARVTGRVRPVQHCGSVDIFLEACNSAAKEDVLVIDNGGILHEGCIGDLTVIEAANAGVSGLLVWGAHRDTAELTALAIPVFSYGNYPAGPAELRPRCNDALATARFGHERVTSDDVVFADADGAIFVQAALTDSVLDEAARIWGTERQQVRAAAEGQTLRQQFDFDRYLLRRANDPSYTFRQHLRERGSAIEE
jgi:regulator of RNase E activity RraA